MIMRGSLVYNPESNAVKRDAVSANDEERVFSPLASG
jgi:hypothetical protein